MPSSTGGRTPPPSPQPPPAASGKQQFMSWRACAQALEREGVDTVFAYPGGASMEIHQALTRSPTIRNILCRHEQVGVLTQNETASPPRYSHC
jgi:acetolactate synthase I/II/III large subunit